MKINGTPEKAEVKKRFENMMKKYFGFKLLEETKDKLVYSVIRFGDTKKLDLLIDAFAYAFEELTFYVFATENDFVSEVRINF